MVSIRQRDIQWVTDIAMYVTDGTRGTPSSGVWVLITRRCV